MTLLLVVLVDSALAAPPCPDLAAQAERGVNAIVSGDSATLDAALADARVAVTCATATAPALAAWWQVEGARARTRGEDPAPWLRSARAASPDFDARLGPELRRVWEAADATETPDAALTLEPALLVTLDGVPVESWPHAVTSGMHLVQVHDPSGSVVFGKLFGLVPGEDALVETGLPPTFVAAAAPTAPGALATPPLTDAPHARRRNATWLVAGSVLATAGGSFALLAHREDDAMRAASTVDQLDAAYARQQAWAWSALALVTAGGASAAAWWIDRAP